MNINMDKEIEKMQRAQAKINENFMNQVATREDVTIPIVVAEEVELTSCTNVTMNRESISLNRFIKRKLYKVEFDTDVLLKDVQCYFDMKDKLFIKCSVRYYN